MTLAGFTSSFFLLSATGGEFLEASAAGAGAYGHAAPTTLAAAPDSCDGCEERLNGENGMSLEKEIWSIELTPGEVQTVEIRETVTGFQQTCRRSSSTPCSERTCNFTYKLQLRYKYKSGTSQEVTVAETNPPTSDADYRLDHNKWTTIVGPITKSQQQCGWDQVRTGDIKFHPAVGTIAYSYSVHVGCTRCE